MENFKTAGTQHYIKWIITPDLSLRYYFNFQDRKEYEGKYFLKSHSKKEYIEIDSDAIIQGIKVTSTDKIEVIGRVVPGKGYVKYTGSFGDEVLVGTSSKKLNKVKSYV